MALHVGEGQSRRNTVWQGRREERPGRMRRGRILNDGLQALRNVSPKACLKFERFRIVGGEVRRLFEKRTGLQIGTIHGGHLNC